MGMRREFPRSETRADDLALMSGALRRRVGLGQAASAAETANAVRVGLRTFEGWLYGETAPRFGELRRLIAHFEPAFATELLTGTGRIVVDTRDRQAAALLRQSPGLIVGLRAVLNAVDPPD